MIYMAETLSHIQNTSSVNERQTEVQIFNRKKLWFLIPIFLAPIVGAYYFPTGSKYSPYDFISTFCVILVGTIQFFSLAPVSNSNESKHSRSHITKKIKLAEINEYGKNERKLITIIMVIAIIIGLMDMFPLYYKFGIIGNGGKVYLIDILLSIILGLLCPIVIAALVTGDDTAGIIARHRYYKITGTALDVQSEDDRLKEERRKKVIKEEHKKRYGEDHIKVACGLIINDTTKKIYYNYRNYDFKDILNFSVRDDAITENSGSISTSYANTRSMIGRAAIGGVITGSTGAIIGGATAKRTTMNSGSQSTVIHDYSIVITVNNINSPNFTIYIGNDEVSLNKIISTLTVILHQNKINISEEND